LQVSAGIDLLLNYARCHEVGRAERLLADLVATVEKAAGWHGWIWRLRLAEVRAEVAFARGDFDEAVRGATDAIELNRGKKIKNEAAGLTTRARALHALGRTRVAITDRIASALPSEDMRRCFESSSAVRAVRKVADRSHSINTAPGRR
jgi:hypothetical protein